ncbi:MAG: hypothetical protein OEX15_14095, partial [Gammaproteobacteria bacterium]|nr:hypothetical protein [Gammaproteobacteria bacterium]
MTVSACPSVTRRRAPTTRTLATLSLLFLAAGASLRVDATDPAPAQPAMAPVIGPAHARPRIGLVLGGGGAKGAAHV